MRWDLVVSIARQLAELGIRVTWLHEIGEPLLYPRLAEAVRLFPGCAVSTNGLLLDETMAHSLLDARISRVRICLDSVDPAVYQRLRPGADYQRVVDNTRTFLQLARGAHVRIEVQRLVTSVTRHESVADFNRLLKLHQFGNAAVITKICSGLDTSQATEVHPGWRGCMARSPVRWFVVLADGRVTHCCYDADGEQTIGNLNVQTIQEVASSDAVRRLERLFRQREFGSLPRCCECYRGASAVQLALDATLRMTSDALHVVRHRSYPESTTMGKLMARVKTVAFLGTGKRTLVSGSAFRKGS